MSKHTHIEWVNRNSLRCFPIVETVSPVCFDGYVLNFDMLVDVKICSPSYVTEVGLKSIFITQNIVSLNFCDQNSTPIATCSFLISESSVNSTQKLYALIDGVAGSVTLGPGISPKRIDQSNLGHHIFTSYLPIEKSCCVGLWPYPIKSIRGNSNGDKINGYSSITFSGDLQASISTGFDSQNRLSNFVIVDLLNKDLYVSKCQKIQNAFNCTKTPIISLNGVPPNPDGFIEVQMDGFGSISFPDENTIVASASTPVNDGCNKPIIPDANGDIGVPIIQSSVVYKWTESFSGFPFVNQIPIDVKTKVFQNPLTTPAIVSITGFVHDDLRIKSDLYGQEYVLNDGEFISGSWSGVDPGLRPLNSSHNVNASGIQVVNQLKITLVKNYLNTASVDISITFSPLPS